MSTVEKSMLKDAHEALLAAKGQFLSYAIQHANKAIGAMDPDERHVDVILMRQAGESLQKAIVNLNMAIKCEGPLPAPDDET